MTLKGHTAAVTGVAFSPDGRRLATSSLDRTVHLWDPATGKVLLSLSGDKAGLLCVAFSPDGRLLASGGDDNAVRLWLAVPGKDPEAVKPVPDKPDPARPLALNMNARPWTQVFEWLSDQTGLPIVARDKPQGTFTFIAPRNKKYSLPEAIDVINEALLAQKYLLIRRPHSFVLVPADEKIDPSWLARVDVRDLDRHGNTELVEVVVPLTTISAEDVAPEIKKLLGPFGQVTPIRSANQLILQDTVGNLRRIGKTLVDIEKAKRP
jgi:type II secretory pathway component GspD/PulD (secretin)